MQDHKFNTPRPVPDFEPTLRNLLNEICEKYGGKDAMVDDDRTISYVDLDKSSAELALQLVASGVSKGTRIGLLLPSGIQFAISFFAASRIGALVVPISTFCTADELSWILRHADINTLLMTDSLLKHNYLERMEQSVSGLTESSKENLFLSSHPFLRQIIVWGDQSVVWAKSPADLVAEHSKYPQLNRSYLDELEREVTPADQLFIIYTSGSTARPKAVLHTHGAAVKHLYVMRYMLPRGPEDRYFCSQPFFWIGGLVAHFLGCLLSGCTLHVAKINDTQAKLEQIRKEKITIVTGWMYENAAMLEHPDFKNHEYPHVRWGLDQMNDYDGKPIDSSRIANSIGMSETVSVHSWEAVQDPLPEHRIGACGRASDGIERKIINPETGEDVPNGEEGEICVRGYNLMQGYYKKEREECFDKDGFFRTGDFGYMYEDGYLFFTGRKDDVVKTAGVNVSTVEVEQQLLAKEGVFSPYVVGIETSSDNILVAAIVLKEGFTADEEEFRRYLRQRLSSYKVPKRFVFMKEDEIPVSPSNKVMKGKLAEKLRAILGEC